MNKILIIDDDKRIRDIIKIQLGKNEFIILEAQNQLEAFNVFETNRVDVVLCDIKMKEIDGITVLKQIKSRSPDLPVIMLSGFINKEISDEARQAGCFDFITKPVKRQKLLEIINKALKEKNI